MENPIKNIDQLITKEDFRPLRDEEYIVFVKSFVEANLALEEDFQIDKAVYFLKESLPVITGSKYQPLLEGFLSHLERAKELDGKNGTAAEINIAYRFALDIDKELIKDKTNKASDPSMLNWYR